MVIPVQSFAIVTRDSHQISGRSLQRVWVQLGYEYCVIPKQYGQSESDNAIFRGYGCVHVAMTLESTFWSTCARSPVCLTMKLEKLRYSGPEAIQENTEIIQIKQRMQVLVTDRRVYADLSVNQWSSKVGEKGLKEFGGSGLLAELPEDIVAELIKRSCIYMRSVMPTNL
ncbi:hypothetical protein Tco_1029504 [Tanacetum coccineum]|uniref:Uncharacterized protein n=1 Tax=Tanacetum coccineum TaxID=301880 RepID=A0ABQ5G4V7_9ASTR